MQQAIHQQAKFLCYDRQMILDPDGWWQEENKDEKYMREAIEHAINIATAPTNAVVTNNEDLNKAADMRNDQEQKIHYMTK